MLDVNGQSIGDGTLELVKFAETASAVNEITVTNSATGNAPEIASSGDDTNIDLKLTPKGTGKLNLDGIKFPNADGSAGQALTTDGSGILSFSTISADGTADWDTTVKTTGFTATANKGYFCNTTSGEITVTLPATPSAGDEVIILDYAGTFDTNKLNISPNGNKIEGNASGVQLTGEREGIRLVYIDSTQGWLGYSGINEGTDALEPQTFLADFLVVAGGGGTSTSVAGGGGAGGYRELSSQLFSLATNYTVTVGAGGAGAAGAPGGNQGSSSVFNTITSAGGGSGSNFGSPNTGGSGGSGGGAGGANTGTATGGTGNTPNTSPSQGNNGGNGSVVNGVGGQRNAGGGGGASGVGSNGTTSAGGNGGNGTASSISGSSVTYAGGGGGSFDAGSPPGTGGTGGTGGGGNGATPGTAATNGTVNTGGGGGGDNGGSGGSGGSGIVIIKYPDTLTITNPGGGLTFATPSAAGGFKRTSFTAGTGSIQFN
jgi:hypothetical protein